MPLRARVEQTARRRPSARRRSRRVSTWLRNSSGNSIGMAFVFPVHVRSRPSSYLPSLRFPRCGHTWFRSGGSAPGHFRSGARLVRFLLTILEELLCSALLKKVESVRFV